MWDSEQVRHVGLMISRGKLYLLGYTSSGDYRYSPDLGKGKNVVTFIIESHSSEISTEQFHQTDFLNIVNHIENPIF